MATVFELHASKEPHYVISPFTVSTSTPVKDSSHNAESEKKVQVKERLWTEMKGGGWVKDPRLLERFTTSAVSPPSFSPPHSVTKEDQLYGPLSDYFNALATASPIQFVDASNYYPRQSREDSNEDFRITSHTPGDHAQSLIRPDLLALDKSNVEDSVGEVGGKAISWKAVKMFCEVKPGHTPAQWLEAREQATMYARQVFRNHPGRRFVFSIVWCHPMFELWHFDRSGGVVSGQHSIYKPKTDRGANLTLDSTSVSNLSRIITSIKRLDSPGLGYDPTVSLPPVVSSETPDDTDPHDGATFTLEAQNDHPLEKFTIERVLFTRNSLRGRATQVWLVRRKNDDKRFILKDSWREYGRPAEWDWYQKVTNATNLPVAYRYGVVKIGGKDDTTDLCRENCGTSDKDGVWLPTVQRRVHERILFETHGSLLWECEDFSEVLRTVRDAVKGHRTLYEANILHRDISTNNILRDAKNVKGILIDLDHAALVEADGGVISDGRSGTLLFMAAEVLANAYLPRSANRNSSRPFRHAVDHDLESFVWVLLHLAVSTPKYEKAKSYLAQRLPQLGAVDTNIIMLSGEKYMFWVDTLNGWSDIGSLLQNHPLWNATNALHDRIVKYRNNKDTTTIASLYEDFVKILDTAAEEPSTTESRKRPLEPLTPPKTSRKRVKTIVYRTPPNLRPRDKKPNYREESE